MIKNPEREDHLNRQAVLYTQCLKRRKRVLRAINRNRLGKTDLTVMDRDRWAAIYDLRLMEVNGNLAEVEADPEFAAIHVRSIGYRLAPWAFFLVGVPLAAALVWGVFALGIRVFFN